ncbi:MAG: DUF4974 domain-containing protein [Marinilabiliaceae bacterium]|nr:DUF4974 domain-containing protein [Marinilabiliaceae bacterium]
MMEFSNSDQGIFRYLAGEMSADEQAQLKQTIAEDEEVKQQFIDLREIWLASGLEKEAGAYDWKQAFQQFKSDVHSYEQKNRKRPVQIKTWWGVAASVAAVMVLFILNYIQPFSTDEPAKMVSITCPKGSRTHVFLPDSTSVWLNGGTVLSYFDNYGSDLREVSLDGEAFFDVVSNAAHPFEVVSGSHHVRVLGTRFNVCAFADEQWIETILEEGSVKVYSPDAGWMYRLKPGEKSVFDKQNGQVITSEVSELSNVIAWKEGLLKFRDAPISQLEKRLERWYGVDIVIQDSTIQNLRFSGTVSEESLEDLLLIFRMSNGIKYRIKEGVYHLYK